MDLRQLRYFLAVIEEGGFRPAARVLAITQPAVSRSVRLLERDLGVRLLERTPSGVALTDAGADFAAHCRAVLRAADDAGDAMRSHALRSGVLRVGAGPLCAGELTDPILSAYRTAHPALALDVQDLSFRDQTGGLRSGRLDVAIVRGPIADPDLELTAIATEPRALLVGPRHDVAAQDEVGVEDVLGEPTVPLDAPDDWAPFWQLDDLRGGPNARPGLQPATTLRSVRVAVADGRSLISVPDAMRRLAPGPSTRFVRLRGATPSTIAVAHRRGDRRAAVRDFVERAGRTAERHIGLVPGGELPG